MIRRPVFQCVSCETLLDFKTLEQAGEQIKCPACKIVGPFRVSRPGFRVISSTSSKTAEHYNLPNTVAPPGFLPEDDAYGFTDGTAQGSASAILVHQGKVRIYRCKPPQIQPPTRNVYGELQAVNLLVQKWPDNVPRMGYVVADYLGTGLMVNGVHKISNYTVLRLVFNILTGLLEKKLDLHFVHTPGHSKKTEDRFARWNNRVDEVCAELNRPTNKRTKTADLAAHDATFPHARPEPASDKTDALLDELLDAWLPNLGSKSVRRAFYELLNEFATVTLTVPLKTGAWNLERWGDQVKLTGDYAKEAHQCYSRVNAAAKAQELLFRLPFASKADAPGLIKSALDWAAHASPDYSRARKRQRIVFKRLLRGDQ